jgi:hypothetical protein
MFIQRARWTTLNGAGLLWRISGGKISSMETECRGGDGLRERYRSQKKGSLTSGLPIGSGRFWLMITAA